MSPFREVSLLTVATGALVTAMTRNGVRRLVCVSALGGRGQPWPTVASCSTAVPACAEKSQMRRFGKWFLIALGSLVVLLAIVITLTIGWSPFFGPKARALTNRTFERTPQRLERGRYIATGLSSCLYCHSPHDWTSRGTPMVAGKEGSGEVLPYVGLPGRIVAPNLTPDRETGAGSWTDDQLARAIREGIGHDGRALFPIMPYQHYRNMSDEDLASVVVYLRSLPAVHNQLPATEISFPVNYLIRSAPEPIAAPVADVVSSDQLKYGTHLADLAGCSDCHTPEVRGQNVSGMDFAGGFPLRAPGVRSRARISRPIHLESPITTRLCS